VKGGGPTNDGKRGRSPYHSETLRRAGLGIGASAFAEATARQGSQGEAPTPFRLRRAFGGQVIPSEEGSKLTYRETIFFAGRGLEAVLHSAQFFENRRVGRREPRGASGHCRR
jgi:hypothetical protein